tara:strand:- start:1434 stop:1733 length:300 start_codon:yes stop_codon:yes gene_type:complete
MRPQNDASPLLPAIFSVFRLFRFGLVVSRPTGAVALGAGPGLSLPARKIGSQRSRPASRPIVGLFPAIFIRHAPNLPESADAAYAKKQRPRRTAVLSVF